jgi:hypothetical protein
MNCPLATNRLIMSTLHHVQTRSGISEEGASEAAAMARHCPRAPRILSTNHSLVIREFFCIVYMQIKKIMV